MGLLMFNLGLFSSWTPAACNKPIFCEIVPSCNRGSAMAWEICLETTSGHLIGPMAVGFVSSRLFNYKASSQLVSEMPQALRIKNAAALGKSISCSAVLPWIICFILYGLLHI